MDLNNNLILLLLKNKRIELLFYFSLLLVYRHISVKSTHKTFRKVALPIKLIPLYGLYKIRPYIIIDYTSIILKFGLN
jgi:hypothetical protein